jgi:hypothetical protein
MTRCVVWRGREWAIFHTVAPINVTADPSVPMRRTFLRRSPIALTATRRGTPMTSRRRRSYRRRHTRRC